VQDNRDDPEVQKVEKEPRFLWDFTRRYRQVKKAAGITPEFWRGLREALPPFEMPATPPPVRPRPSPPPNSSKAKIPPATKIPAAFVAATPPSSVARPSSPPPIPAKPARRPPWAMKKLTKRSGKGRMIVEDEDEEEEEEKEKEGEEEEKEEEEEEEEELKGREGIRGRVEDDAWEGEDEIEVDTPVHNRCKADINRRPPQPSGKYRTIPCRKCQRMGRDCEVQTSGYACVTCAQTKAKCEPGEATWTKGGGKAAGTRKPAPPRKVKPQQSQPDWGQSKAGPSRRVLVPAPKPRRRMVKSAVYVFSSDEESEGETKAGAGRGASPSPPAPAPAKREKEEAKVAPSRPAPEKTSKAGPSRPAPAPEKREAALFGSDEESEPVPRKDKGKGKEGKSNVLSVFYILKSNILKTTSGQQSMP